MKKILLSALLLAFLQGCGGNDENGGQNGTPENGGATSYALIEKSTFSIRIPETWREMLPADFDAGPGTVAIFRSGSPAAGVFPNIVVTRESIRSSLTPLEFSRATVENESVSLIGFQLISEETVRVAGQNTILVHFVARSAPEKRELHFWQLFLTKENIGYVFTAGAAKNTPEEVRQQIRTILTSISLR